LRYEGPKDRNRIPAKLDPTKGGYLLTQGDAGGVRDSDADDGSDYNIVHTRWQLTYQIADAELFFRRVHVKTVEPGEIYFDVITEDIKPLLQSVFEDAVVTAMVDFTIDDVLFERVAAVTDRVRALVEQKLADIKCGIKVVSVQLLEKTWPRQVDQAFIDLVSASNESQGDISTARTTAAEMLNNAAGPVADELYKAINDPNATEAERELLWSRLSGLAQNEIYDAEAYRTTVARNAEANANYLESLLPEYRKHPELVIQRIYLDAIENVFANAQETIVFEPSDVSAARELRMLLNRDLTLKRKKAAGQSAPQENPDQP
jgi:regulator of protease activity HflC (stomatin/prohibitin superfamily)